MPNALKSEVSKWYWIFVGAVFLGSLAVAIFVTKRSTEITLSWLWFAIGVNFFTTFATVILALLIQRAKDVSRKEDWNDHIVNPILAALGDVVRCVHKFTEVPWARLFEQTNEIDFVVQGWDNWENDVRAPLRAFLKREGKINLFVHHDGADYRDTLHSPWMQRTKRTDQQARDEITGTIQSIADAVREAVPTAKLDKRLSIHLMKHLNWFCAIRFGPDRLLLSVYAHHHRSGVEAPFFLIRTDIHKEFGSWFDRELEQLKASSESAPFPPPKQAAATTQIARAV